jgi:hypothetical protein
MEIGSEFFSSTKIIESPPGPSPKLLLELEPARRVFLENLLDIVLFRSPAPLPTTSRPGRFWSDVFVPTSMPWWGFGESMLWHLLFVAGLWSLSQGIALHHPALLQPNPHRSYISYYRPSPTFPVAGSRPATQHENARVKGKAAPQSRIQVAREGKPGLVVPPDLKLGQPGQPDLPGSGGALPAMPFSATARSKFNVPGAPGSAVGPPPEIHAAAGRRGGLPSVSVVAPPPDVAAISSRRGLGAPATAVVEPPPSVKGALRKFGDVNIAHAEVVAPAPRLPVHEQRAGVAVDQAGLGGSSTSIVPPPPSLERSGTLNGGRTGSMAGTGMQIVPPPPSIDEANNSTPGARVGSRSATGVEVVPPPPSIEGVGNASGRGRGSGLTDNALGVVPPAPAARNLGGTGRRSRGTSLSGSGLQVVPPPPSTEAVGGGSGGNGRGTALSGNGLDVVPPAPSGRGIGGSMGGGRGRGGALGGTGLQASGPSGSGARGSGRGSVGSPDGVPNGNGTSPAGSSQMASAGVPGAGTGTGAGAGSGAGTGTDGGGSATGNGHEDGGAGAGNGTGAATGAGTGRAGASATGGAGSGTSGGIGGSGPGSSAGSPSGSPSGSNPDAVNIGAGGRPFAADIPRARPPILDNPPGPQDLPLRVIGLAMSLPSSSYFSNYEVFIAERRVSKDETQLIKLVYESLPYQRRLSEYGLNNRVFKLRVTRDPSCDESLIQMTWPDAGQEKPGAKPATDSPELKSGHDDKLPCYRTTADAYRKALSHGR